MTSQQALSTWPAIKAFGEGRKIQWKLRQEPNSGWCDYDLYDPAFEDSAYEWREKPAPRVRWVRVMRDGTEFLINACVPPAPQLGTELVRFTEDVR